MSVWMNLARLLKLWNKDRLEATGDAGRMLPAANDEFYHKGGDAA
jgi:hypothetical protein